MYKQIKDNDHCGSKLYEIGENFCWMKMLQDLFLWYEILRNCYKIKKLRHDFLIWWSKGQTEGILCVRNDFKIRHLLIIPRVQTIWLTKNNWGGFDNLLYSLFLYIHVIMKKEWRFIFRIGVIAIYHTNGNFLMPFFAIFWYK